MNLEIKKQCVNNNIYFNSKTIEFDKTIRILIWINVKKLKVTIQT